MFTRLAPPAIGVLLGLLPFLLFVGSTNTVDVNGVRVREDSFNLLGLILAVIGIVLAMRSIRPLPGVTRLRPILAVFAIVVCLVQILVSIGLLSTRPIVSALWPDSDLPPLTFTELDEGNLGLVKGLLQKDDLEQIKQGIAGYKLNAIAEANRHVSYADVCHGGRYRVDLEAVNLLPDFMSAEDRADLERRVAADHRTPPTVADCTPRNTTYRMGELVDRVNRSNAMADALIAGYLEKHSQ
ncbi:MULTISPECIES: hypothetical protein [Rhizobium]|uniref:Transmembrane protein n=1 Tax=Rhizobium leguminosarum bv. viciae TaxID=387 RepID=A0A8I2KJF3_RHILV|nr:MULTISPECIES: hypothetical protein [Rhizobium]KAF5884405.1 hypothetical protein FY112_16110 [Rhizobium sp. PEPV16]MBY5774671.1 hypothetical protein [Rhizobium leguminosarum]MBY5795187.1 hypothetical protein [Rhizobium leguminosarum]MBY5801835.1 hypothetical protein [Rhizobium leguminosarum]NKM16083.1 hypothetical protein [Rhizobium laguerreae]